jgi:2-polyprenyl-3-methyl-5-hydroxy-6-metoxy-1,4-benzoquinol methylase
MSWIQEMQSGLFGGPLDEARVRAYWESMSPSYAPDASAGLVRYSHRRQHDAVFRLARPASGRTALDAGAGSGLLTRRLLEAGCVVTAVDASEAMVEQLREVTGSAVQARLEDLDLRETFDDVYAIGVLNFVCTPEDTLRRLCSHVRTGGTLTLQVTELSVFGLLYWLTYLAKGFRPFLFSRRWLVDRTRQHGFGPIVSTHPFPHDLTIAFRRL